MHVISRSTLVAFYGQPQYHDAAEALQAWYDVARQAAWSTPADVKAQYRNASFVGNNRVVFNIKGNDYRLVVALAYRTRRCYVKFVGTHRQYDAVDAATVDQSQKE